MPIYLLTLPKDLDGSRAKRRASRVPRATPPPLAFQQWELELSSTSSWTGLRRDARGTYSQPPFVRP